MSGNPEWAVPQLQDPRYSQSVERGLAILECFTPDRRLLGVADIAHELGMSRSTTHRYIVTLQALGYLKQDYSRKYRLGLRVTSLGMSTLSSMGLRDNAHPYLEQLARRTTFTASLAVLDGVEITYIDQVHSVQRAYRKTHLTIEAGARLPAAATSMGKLLLAFLPDDDELTARLREIKFKRFGPNTIMTKTALRRELAAIRELGLATDDEEQEGGFYTIAAPIRDSCNEVAAALDLVAPRATIALPEMVSALGSHLISTAADISARLGHRVDSSDRAGTNHG